MRWWSWAFALAATVVCLAAGTGAYVHADPHREQSLMYRLHIWPTPTLTPTPTPTATPTATATPTDTATATNIPLPTDTATIAVVVGSPGSGLQSPTSKAPAAARDLSAGLVVLVWKATASNPSDSRYLTVDVTEANESQSDYFSSSGDFEVEDSQNSVTSATTPVGFFNYDAFMSATDVPPGGRNDGWLAFNISRGAQTYTLLWKSDPLGTWQAVASIFVDPRGHCLISPSN